MATRAQKKSGKSTDLQERAMVMAVAIITDRIKGLPKQEKKDLYELMKEIPNANTDEALEEITAGMLEILDQEPITASVLDVEKTGDRLENWMKFIGTRIKMLRESCGMTQTELAEKSGLPQSHISRLEALKHSPSRMTLEKIAAALGVEVGQLDPCD